MKNAFVAVLILIPFLLIAIFALDFFLGYETYCDVEYGELECEVMDIFIPRKAYKRQTNGCVLLIHGGSWSGGDKSEEELMCRYLASRGYIAATMNYSLYSAEDESYNVSVVMDEIDAALQKLVAFAAERGIVIDKAATSGYSAGAHLSMLYSFSRGDKAPVEIMFTANMAGPAEISPELWGDARAIRIGEMLSGKKITDEMINSGEAEKILESISPTRYVNPNTPPSIFAYGGKDPLVIPENGEALKNRFDEAGVKYDYVFFPDSDHALIHNFGKRIVYAGIVIDYCREYF